MTEDAAGENQKVTCEIEVFSENSEVDAGTEISLKGSVTCSDGSDRLGERIEILDQEGEPIGALELIDFDGETNGTSQLSVPVPTEPGEYIWSAVLPAQELEKVIFGESKADFRFTVRPHLTRIEVWDVPPAIACGEEFSIKVGIKCSAGCDQAGRGFEIVDEEDTRLATGQVGDEPWRGTKGLFFAEVVLRAPQTEGRFRWKVISAASDAGLPHESGTRSFGSNLVGRPEYEVTVEAVDRKKQTPIRGMHVLLHPFRARTDDTGVAKLAVPKGDYLLLVSGFKYFPYRQSLSVSEDVRVTAEVEWEETPERISG